MRRAVLIPFAVLIVAASITPSFAAQVDRASEVIDGAGMVNYMQRPSFQVGTWTKYRTLSKSEQGFKDDYTVTILAAGEEVWWGEPCLWIETRTQKVGDRERVTATLISYSAFGDSMADKHILWFIRKTINGITPSGKPDIALYSRDKAELGVRRAAWGKEDNPAKIDSVGLDTITVAAGSFNTYKVNKYYGLGETAEQGDSTVYYERRLNRTFFFSHQVPFTNLARVDIDDLQQGKTWLAGKFDKGPLKVLERARGKTELVAYGTSGVPAVLVPEASRRAIDRKLIEQVLDGPAEPATPVQPKRHGTTR